MQHNRADGRRCGDEEMSILEGAQGGSEEKGGVAIWDICYDTCVFAFPWQASTHLLAKLPRTERKDS